MTVSLDQLAVIEVTTPVVEYVVVVEPPLEIVTEVPGLQGPPGPAGASGIGAAEALVQNVVLATAVQPNTIVALDSTGMGVQASSSVAEHAHTVLGICRFGGLAGESVEVLTEGRVTGSSLPVGPLFLGLNGVLTSNPSTGLFQLQIGTGLSPTYIQIRPQSPIFF